MGRSRTGWITLVVVGALAVPLAVASLAFACARLATLDLDRKGARPGATINAEGRNFSNNEASSAVALRLNSRRGPVLWEGRPDRQGRFAASFQVPNARRGHYVVLATQLTGEGRPAAGTPGRAPLKIRRARRRAAAVAPVATTTPGGGGLPSAPTVAIPFLLLLGGAGATAIVAGARRREGRPAARS